jgi:hypothetical protein
LKLFLDSMGGGAWPFLVGGVICLVNSVNERDLDLLNRPSNLSGLTDLRNFFSSRCLLALRG